MANSADVKIGADTSGFEAGLNRGIASMSKFKKEATSSFEQVRTAMSTLRDAFAVFGIGLGLRELFNSLKSVFEAASAVRDMADNLNVGTEALQEMQQVAAGSGVEIELLGRMMTKLNQATLDFKNGVKTPASEALLEMGFRPDQFKDMKTDERMAAVGASLSSIPDNDKRLGLAGDVFGERVGGRVVSFLKEYSGVRGQTGYFTASDKAVQQAADTSDWWSRFWLRSKSVSAQAALGWNEATSKFGDKNSFAYKALDTPILGPMAFLTAGVAGSLISVAQRRGEIDAVSAASKKISAPPKKATGYESTGLRSDGRLHGTITTADGVTHQYLKQIVDNTKPASHDLR